YGKVRGFIMKDIHTFLGIPYGADTSGKNRFMPPQKPAPWSKVYPATYWGMSAPQLMDNFYANRYLAFTDDWHYDELGEDCLKLNVWTPKLDALKRPVLFWMHGGGFTSGNSIEHPEYHGENLSRFGDVVFVSINHRLGAMGFSNFAGVGGAKYEASGNVGMLDCVAALEWVRDNIANFGGDPGNVTIMGQSGGGAKVCTLMAMPSAKGLFHRAVALSGSSLRGQEKANSERLGAAVVRHAGVSVEKLQEMPWKEYIALANHASRELRESAAPGGPVVAASFGPVVDGKHMAQHPFFPEGSPLSANIPMIISSTFYERSPSSFDSSLENISKAEAKEQLKTQRGFGVSVADNASVVYDAYEKAFPDRKPIEIVSMAISNRKNVVAVADVKARQTPDVYVDWFGWNPVTIFDGRLRAFHTLDISFWFYNTDRQLSHTGGGSRARKMAEKMAGALVAFMKTGSPNASGLPQWPKYTSEKGETMVYDDIPVVKNDPDREARKTLPA
ncbi:MAG TPA: carboxylesterase family protein, partial [Cyclobacteriaceae bacterium]|nr:carboxylesterase family protein [Cyclobacteriaceae bacterium]